MKRQRGRGRKPSNPGNRSYESNGPDVKIRGNANQVYEKYLQYARDAQTSGDRINAEAYFQHAEHYFRIMAQFAPKERPPQAGEDADGREDDDMQVQNAQEGGEQSSQGQSDQEHQPNQGRRRNPRRRDQDTPASDADGVKVAGLAVMDGEGENPEDLGTNGASDGEGNEGGSRKRRPRPRRKPQEETQAAEPAGSDASGDDAGLRAMMARSPVPVDPPSETSETEPVES